MSLTEGEVTFTHEKIPQTIIVQAANLASLHVLQFDF